ncbi:MAG: hypothetical protein DRJ47_10310 [Thermoprotei archaeon]|nr:MAG: hypothetical protein DRJ47_10310 [Thermoprotei archaeon]
MCGFWDGLLWGLGYEPATEKKRCRFCHRQIPADAKYCPYCGKRLNRYSC